ADKRCKSMDVAVRMAKWAGLAGIVTHADAVVQSPRIVSLARRHRLLVTTYGGSNSKHENVQLQKAYHVDAVIADDACA
ncbi:hypothetical protein COEREDRAFT_33581, partial [Coemansia reversa NRRL 1564]